MRSIKEFSRFRTKDVEFQRYLAKRAEAMKQRCGLILSHRPTDLVDIRRRYNRLIDRQFDIDYPLKAKKPELLDFLRTVTSELYEILARGLRTVDATMARDAPKLDDIETVLIRDHWNSYFAADVATAVFAGLHSANFTVVPLITHSAGETSRILTLCQQTDDPGSSAYKLFSAFLGQVFPS